jgi:2-polyprenyl-3-methyl-5-hydroxy-6-metoxy-1,4-benzoquinol methylase
MSDTSPVSAPVRDRDGFYEYYAEESLSEATLERFESTRATVMRVLGMLDRQTTNLRVADIGCGAGTQCRIWARDGHTVFGCDVNEGLIELARHRAQEEGLAATTSFQLASAESLPLGDCSVDVCLLPELLEHVVDWERCLDECSRIVRPGGLLFLSTTNKLCPVQQEFDLPLYSWYPSAIKRHFEKLSTTTRPELVNHATYPAIHWFSFYTLRKELARRGFDRCLDRFDCIDTEARSGGVRAAVRTIRALAPLRLLAHACTPYTALIAIRTA